MVSAGIGIAAALLVPQVDSRIVRGLIGWNVCVWCYLAWTGWVMTHSDTKHLKLVARAQAEGASTVLIIVSLAALASFGAVVMELSAAKAAGARSAVTHVLVTLSTVVGSWLMVPTLFSLNYASRFHASAAGAGLKFPEQGDDYEPDYLDFLYFSFTIAVASQTSDVLVTDRSVRRLVLLQSVLSFVFNTTILAFTINIAAALI